jgi:hypothetical protein
MSLNIYAIKGNRKSKRPFEDYGIIKATSKIDILEEGNLIRVSILEDKLQEDDKSLNIPLMYLTIRSREDFVVTEDNWLEYLLGPTKFPVAFKNLDFPTYSRQIMSFTSMNIIYDYGKYFISTVDGNSQDNDYIFMIDDSTIDTEVLKNYNHGLAFDQSSDVESSRIMYSHKSLSCVVKYKDSEHTKGFRIPFKESISPLDCFKMHLTGDKNFSIDKDMFDLDTVLTKNSILTLSCVKVNDFYYFESEDKSVRFTSDKNASLLAIKATMNSVSAIANPDTKLFEEGRFRDTLMDTLNSEVSHEKVIFKCVYFINSINV